MDVVWRFVAGLTKMQNIGWDEVKSGEWVFRQVGHDTVTVGPSILQCLYEAQDVQSCKEVFGQYRVKALSGYGLSNYELFALGYCISVCSNTWNVSTPHIPREGVEMLGHGMKSVNYGGGSIEELELLGSRGVMNEGKHLLQMPRQMLQHIKLLNLGVCGIDKRGFANLAECIAYLNSLISLNIHTNPGGEGSLVKLFRALRKHGKLQTLNMQYITLGMDDVAALAGLVQPLSSLRELMIDTTPVSSSGASPAADVVNELVRTVLSTSSLNIVKLFGCEYPLDGIETISDSISSLSLYYPPPHSKLNTSPRLLTASRSRVKGGTKLSYILRENTSLEELFLLIPLDKDEVQDILDSLKDNHSLERMWLSKEYHSQYFSELERQAWDRRVTIPSSYKV